MCAEGEGRYSIVLKYSLLSALHLLHTQSPVLCKSVGHEEKKKTNKEVKKEKKIPIPWLIMR